MFEINVSVETRNWILFGTSLCTNNTCSHVLMGDSLDTVGSHGS